MAERQIADQRDQHRPGAWPGYRFRMGRACDDGREGCCPRPQTCRCLQRAPSGMGGWGAYSCSPLQWTADKYTSRLNSGAIDACSEHPAQGGAWRHSRAHAIGQQRTGNANRRFLLGLVVLVGFPHRRLPPQLHNTAERTCGRTRARISSQRVCPLSAHSTPEHQPIHTVGPRRPAPISTAGYPIW